MSDEPLLSDESDDDDDKVFYEEDPIEGFRLLAEANKWPVSEQGEDENQCFFVATDGAISLPVTVQWLQGDELLMVSIAYELECLLPAHMHKLCLKMNEINEQIIIGSVIYQEEYGLLIWKAGMTLFNTGGITHDQVTILVESGMTVFKTYIKSICGAIGVQLENNELMLAASADCSRMN